MALYAFRKVNCIDPCDANAIMTRNLALLVQVTPIPISTKTKIPRSIGWQPEAILVNPVRVVDEITDRTCIQKIHVIDSVFGNQIVQYIMDQEPLVRFNTSYDREKIAALWVDAVRAPRYSPGQARATLAYNRGEVKMDGARSDFVASFNAKYPVTEEVPADDVPTYCNCLIKGDDASDRLMIQCANEERYCLKEWYHLDGCISMTEEEVPPDDVEWFCDDCTDQRLGKLKTKEYIPWKPWKAWEQKEREVPDFLRKRKLRRDPENLQEANIAAIAEKDRKKVDNRGNVRAANHEYRDMEWTDTMSCGMPWSI